MTNGFSGITVTEDCETAFELHRAGWTSVYVDKPLTAGLQPETFGSFIDQRSRWCQGMFQLFLMKSPVLKPGLTPIQRLAYLSNMTYWLFPLPRIIFRFAPLMHIFFDIKLFVSTVDEAVAYAATYVVVSTMIQNELFGHVRWPWMSELYEYVQGVYLVKAIASVAISPRKPTFKVTAKRVLLDSDHLSERAWPFIASFIALLLGVATAAWRYTFEPGVTDAMLVVGLWALFNLVIAGAALGVVAERRELRRNPRLVVKRGGQVCFDFYTADASIENVSVGGCAIRVAAAGFVERPARTAMSWPSTVWAAMPERRRSMSLDPHRAQWRRRHHRPEVRGSLAGRLSGARRPHVWRRRSAGQVSGETPQAYGHPSWLCRVLAVGRMRAGESLLVYAFPRTPARRLALLRHGRFGAEGRSSARPCGPC
jgi:hypothetical protein